jgi:hypothetical protein
MSLRTHRSDSPQDFNLRSLAAAPSHPRPAAQPALANDELLNDSAGALRRDNPPPSVTSALHSTSPDCDSVPVNFEEPYFIDVR